MPYRLKGTLKLPATSQPAAGVDIEFISRRNYSPLLMDLSSIIKTSPTGAYDVTLEYGEYAVVLYWGCNQPSHIGKLFVFADTVAGLDLQTLLQQSDWQPATPEYIQQIQDWLAQSASSASQAVNSAAAAKASETAAEADRAEVASNKNIVVSAQTDVTNKRNDVTTKAAQVATNTATVNEKTPLAVAAADTASQKAVAAAASDASARDAANRAENAALAMTGAILDGGQCNLSGGAYPPALTVNGKKYSTVWYVRVGGTVSGTAYDAGDKLQYTTANNGFYFRIDARDEVVSVQGEKGAVVLTPQKIGADPTGTASALVNNLKNDPNPFPQYSDFVSGEPRTFASRAQLAKRAAQYHPLDGQLVPRSTDAGLLAAIIAGDVPSCSDADWLADKSNRGMYTLGDGSTNIRLPDWNGKSAGALGALVIRGDGLNADIAGKIQRDAIRNITGSTGLVGGSFNRAYDIGSKGQSGVFKKTNRGRYDAGNIAGGQLPNDDLGESVFDASLVVPTGPENRMINTSGVHAVKR